MGRVYKYIGHYEDVDDYNWLKKHSADKKVEYFLKKIGHFYYCENSDEESNINEDELDWEAFNKEYQFSNDEKYIVRISDDTYVDYYQLVENKDALYSVVVTTKNKYEQREVESRYFYNKDRAVIEFNRLVAENITGCVVLEFSENSVCFNKGEVYTFIELKEIIPE